MSSGVISSVTMGEFYDLPKHIRDLRMVKEYEINCPVLGIFDAYLMGVTSERCAEDLDPAMGGGVVCGEASFYESEEMVCLVSQEAYAALGDDKTVKIMVTDPVIDRTENPELGWGSISFRVAGYYNGMGDTIYMPFAAALKLGTEISQRTSCDSIAFLAADNRRLDALSEAASEFFGAVDPLANEHSTPKYALIIHDEQYRATVAALEQNIERTGHLLPLVSLLGLGTGLLISFLATRGESRTYALMRTMGMTRGKLFFSVLREQIVLPAVSVLLVAVLTEEIPSAGFYLLCYATGCCAAVIRAVRTAPTAILREQE